MSNPWVTRDSSSLPFYKSLGVFALSTTCVTRDDSSLLLSESQGLVGLSKPFVTRDNSSLMLYESLEAVWAVESMRHTLPHFVDAL